MIVFSRLLVLLVLILAVAAPVLAGGRRGHRPVETEPEIVEEAPVEEDSSIFGAYAYPKEPRVAQQAATSSFAEAFCGGAHVAVQTPGVGVSLSGARDRACARLALAEKSITMADAILGSENPDLLPIAMELYRDAHDDIDRARAELELDDTRLRGFWVTILGSLPVLHIFAPR